MRKYIFVTGGAVSDASKTVVASSLGLMLASRGFKVINKKLSPYINITLDGLDPQKYGETFLLENGEGVDSSVGYYERFTGEKANENSFQTAGRIYWSVINKERMGDYFGNAVTVSSHVAKEIKDFIYEKDEGDEIVIVEVGGAVKDSETVHFQEAIGSVREEKGADNVMYVHVEKFCEAAESVEEKIIQIKSSLSSLRLQKIKPDAVLCECDVPADEAFYEELALLCNVSADCIAEIPITDYVGAVPLYLEKQGLAAAVLKNLVLQDFKPKMERYKAFVANYEKAETTVKIAVVGKYSAGPDAYLSVKEALFHGASAVGVKLQIKCVDAGAVDVKTADDLLKNADGIILPDGRGTYGTEGMIITAAYARKKDIPFFAIGQGMHMAVSEFAQNVLGLKGAQSVEVTSSTPYPVVKEADSFKAGAARVHIMRNTKAYSSYKRELFYERHRQRYVVNDAYKEKLWQAGMYFTGELFEGGTCEIVDVADNKWYIGVQFNPELSSNVCEPHPLFTEFIKAAKAYCENV